jgi:hypothetical protein
MMPKLHSIAKIWSIAALIIGDQDGTINGSTTFKVYFIDSLCI